MSALARWLTVIALALYAALSFVAVLLVLFLHKKGLLP